MCCSHGLREPYGAHEQHGRHSQRARRSLTPKADARSKQSGRTRLPVPARTQDATSATAGNLLFASCEAHHAARSSVVDGDRPGVPRFHERGSRGAGHCRPTWRPAKSESRSAAVSPPRHALRGLGGRRRPRDGDAHSSPCKACARTRVCPASPWLWRATGRAGPTPRAKKRERRGHRSLAHRARWAGARGEWRAG